MPFTPPWVADAIFYQIFPDRFSNGDRSNDPAGTEEWGAKPTPRNFFGGDLRGIIERLPYLKDLGITAIYLNPIFTAGSNHKYNAADYQSIDPSFGSNDIFKEFLRICHTESIRVVIDGVFNHTGTDHRAFKDVKARGAVSSYAGWYNIFSYPVQPPSKPNYECWWNYGSLPRLMVQNPDVRNHLFEITRYWTELGVDGWRLDVANEIPHAFWKDWRKLVKSINPDCYITGEIWTDASAWLQGDEFDAVMNYRFREACLDYFVRGTISGTAFVAALNHVRSTAPEESAFAMQNLLGSHDTERILTFCRDDVGTERLAVLMQMTYVGAPMVYYGDEIGMTGGKDPDCRRTMIWDESRWNTELRTYYK
ncbi:MAG: glycoside hydrolase family 13 protein, partial [Ignavibacteriales bacterium]|nr:glycoside hydrolase family 13 protein [Ignavibacteriales bacterium]